MVVLEPLKVTITNFHSDQPIELTVPRFPADESRGSHKIKFDSVIYIEKSDFSEVLKKEKIQIDFHLFDSFIFRRLRLKIINVWR